MSSQKQSESSTRQCEPTVPAVEATGAPQTRQFNHPSAAALSRVSDRIAEQFKSARGHLIDGRAQFKTRVDLETSLQALASKYALAEAQLQQLTPEHDSDQSPHQETSHLRVLKDLAGQQQRQLSKFHLWRSEIATLCRGAGASDLADTDLEALSSAVKGLASRRAESYQPTDQERERLAGELAALRQQHLQLQSESESERVIGAQERQALIAQCDRLARERESIVAQAAEQSAPEKSDEKEQAIRQLESALAECEETLNNSLAQLAELERIAGERAMLDRELQSERQRRAGLEGEREKWALQNQTLTNQREGLSSQVLALQEQCEELQRCNAELKSAPLIADATGLGTADLQKLQKAEALWRQGTRQVAEYQQQVAQLQREKSALTSRGGLLQARLEEHFKLNQRLKKELQLARDGDERERIEVSQLREALKALEGEKTTWSSQRLQLQRELVEQAQIAAEAKQREGQQLAENRNLDVAASHLRQRLQTLEERLAQREGELANERRAASEVSQEHSTRLERQHREDEAKLAQAEATGAAIAQELKGQLLGFERQNGELQRQVAEAIETIRDLRARLEEATKEQGQVQKSLQQLIEQIGDKDSQIHLLQRQLHKKSKETVALQEQLSEFRETDQQLQIALRSQREAQDLARGFEEESGVRAKLIERLEGQVQRAQVRLAQLEEIERNHNQLQQVLAPLRDALTHRNVVRDEPLLPKETGDLFDESDARTRLGGQLFDR